jgi:hypothetical protein
MVDPEILCRRHLLGEHNEIHKFRSTFERGYSIKKRVERNQIEPFSMKSRHDELAEEMMKRGYRHSSPYEMPNLSSYPWREKSRKVDLFLSLQDLLSRCPECNERYQKLSGI